jgi:ornithine cyclodeaminase/alanine dehydrogenase-like protein (mu-crystallin family)
VDLGEVIPAIERCYADYEKGEDILPNKFILYIGGGQAACITGYTKSTNVLTMKLGQERVKNRERGLPTSFGVINLFDPDTGELLMICEAALPTALRTAAAAAVSARQLARIDSRVIGLVGTGRLGVQCIKAISHVFDFDKILLSDRNNETARNAALGLSAELNKSVEAVSFEDACRHSDIVVTAMNSFEPVVKSEWIKAGTHLCCMGADLHEKIECEPEILSRCRIFADNVEHCRKRGEASLSIEKGIVSENIHAGSIGQVINGTIPGRTSVEEITMFDSVGLGTLDSTISKTIYDSAMKNGFGSRVEFV